MPAGLSKYVTRKTRATIDRGWWTRHRPLIVCFVLSLILHLVPILSRWEVPSVRREIKRRPIRVKFVVRAPRLLKPLELARKPQVVTRKLTRRIATPTVTIPRVLHTAATHGGTALASLARPGEVVDRSLEPVRRELGPVVAPGAIEPQKETSAASLQENLLDPYMLDTGRYRAMVFQDPNDKRKVSGYFHMDLIKYRTNHIRDWDGNPGWNTEPAALPNVAEAVEKYTDIKMDLARFLTLDSEEIMQSPMLVLTGEAEFEWTAAEAQNLGRYLRQGGFLFVDDSSDQPMVGSPFDRSARSLLQAALGDDCVFEKLPNGHWLYHCFFDFDGPPMGFDYRFARQIHAPYDYLEAIFLDGRMAVLYSNKAYCKFWDHAYVAEPEHALGDPTRQLQFGVNIVVFALTQPGGIVWRQMAYRQ